MLKRGQIVTSAGKHTFFGKRKSPALAETVAKRDEKIAALATQAIREEYSEKIKASLGEECTEEAAEEIFQGLIAKMKAEGSFDRMCAEYIATKKHLKEEAVAKANNVWRAAMDDKPGP